MVSAAVQRGRAVWVFYLFQVNPRTTVNRGAKLHPRPFPTAPAHQGVQRILLRHDRFLFSFFFLSVFHFCMFFFVFSFLLQFLDFGKNAVVVNTRRDGHHWAHAVPHAGSGTMWGQGDRSTRPPRARHFTSMYREVPPVPPLLPCLEPRASPGQHKIHSPVLSQGPSLSAWERRGGSLPLSLCTPESQSHA